MRLVVMAALAASTISLIPSVAAAQRHVLTGSDVAIYNLAGTIEVRGSSGGDVVATVTPGGRDSRSLRVETSRVGSSEALLAFADAEQIVYPPLGRGSRSQLRVGRSGTFFDDGAVDRIRSRTVTISGSGRGVEAWADVVVELPPGRTVRLYAGVGSIDVANVQGTMHVRTASARSELRDVRGSVALRTSSGGATIEGVSGSVRATSSSGTLRVSNAQGGHHQIEASSGNVDVTGVVGDVVRLGASSGSIRGGSIEGGDVEMRASSGSIRVNGVRADRYTARTSSGRIVAQNVSAASIDVGASSGSIELSADTRLNALQAQTSSGSVRAAIPRTFGGSVEIRSSSGGISFDVPVTTTAVGRRELVGTVGDGSGTLRIRTASGSIRVTSH